MTSRPLEIYVLWFVIVSERRAAGSIPRVAQHQEEYSPSSTRGRSVTRN